MTDDVTVIVEGGPDETQSALPESSATGPDSVAVETAATAAIAAEQAQDSAEFALVAANEALDRTDQTLTEVQELRKDAQEEWKTNLLQSLAEMNQKLDQILTPPNVPTESDAGDLEIVTPPADETPMKRERGRKRTLGLKW